MCVLLFLKEYGKKSCVFFEVVIFLCIIGIDDIFVFVWRFLIYKLSFRIFIIILVRYYCKRKFSNNKILWIKIKFVRILVVGYV